MLAQKALDKDLMCQIYLFLSFFEEGRERSICFMTSGDPAKMQVEETWSEWSVNQVEVEAKGATRKLKEISDVAVTLLVSKDVALRREQDCERES